MKLKKHKKELPLSKSDFISRPPLGLIPKNFFYKRVESERFNEVCGAISRFYNAGKPIKLEWINEYNELVERINNQL